MSGDSTPFTIEAPPATDIWKKPPSTNIFNAPISRTSTGLLSKFHSARVTFWADWHERYDQGGILLVPRRRSSAPPSAASPPAKWIKTGVELYQGAPQLSTVSTDRYADWSVSALDTTTTTTTKLDAERGVTIEIVREGDENGKSAWVYQVVRSGSGSGSEETKIPLREICWIFADEHEGAGTEDEWILEVSPLVARPEKNATAALGVRFREFRVEWAA